MKKPVRLVGYAFRYFSYFVGLSVLYAAVTDPERAKNAFNAGAETTATR